jgi:hypothetical protein
VWLAKRLLYICIFFGRAAPDRAGARPYHPKTCVFGLSNILSDHLVADVEMLEARIEHAVFVKVYLAAIRGLVKP